ncbi:hypothetical protein JM84_3051 [Dokdonia sp. Hel_I_63]|uniref:sensor histidine kinase n=1 Tax=Dokdonia sp. Hel_I_63 TaxID=1249996 RepID=UPI001199AD9E|nr:histidine kinase [Dokdonia sp. Hel_I_63]TVZ24092.1 hypothetical protein JM84_3051 [Dokdonia sp. Hel_I_63]
MSKQLQITVRLFILVLFLSSSVFGQKYPSTHFDISNGLPNNAIRSILKTSDGSIWIGTDNGIAVLKNGEIERYNHPDIPNGMVWDMRQDADSAIWVGTYGKGLFKIDGNSINRYHTDNGLANNHIRKIWIKRSTVYVGMEDGLAMIQNDSITNFTRFDPDVKLQVQDFFEYKNELYIVTFRSGLLKLITTENQNKLKKVREYKHAFAVELLKDTVYLSNDGVTKLFTIDGFINGAEPFKQITSSISWDYADVNATTAYTAMWGVHTDDGGVYKIKNESLIFQNEAFGIKSRSIWSIKYDAENQLLYVGTLDNGLYRIDISNKILSNLTDSKVKDVLQVEDLQVVLTEKNVFIQNSTGVISINPENFLNYKQQKIRNNPELKNTRNFGFINKHNNQSLIFHRVQQHRNLLWISTNAGLYKLSKSGILLDYVPVHNEVFDFACNGDLIVAIPYHGVQIFSENNPIEKTYFEPKKTSTPKDVNEFITLGSKQYLISRTRGLFEYDGNRFDNVLYTDGLVSASNGNDRNLYLAFTDGTIRTYDVQQRKIIDTLSQNRYKGQSIQFIKYDDHRLIIGTERGINILTDSTEILVDSDQGLTDIFIQNASISGDTLLVGTNSGYYSIDLNSFAPNKNIEPLEIKSLEINFAPLESLPSDSVLELTHDQNNLSVQFSVPHHPYPNKLEYSYKIDNDAKWTSLRTPKVFLPFVPSGTHSIYIKVKDWHNGTTHTQLLLNFTIATPIWKSWWLWIGSVSLVCILIFIGFYFRLKRKNKHQQHIASIEQRLTTTKLEALQSQMNPHFTFNAMNSIQNYIIDNDVDNALFFMGEFSKLMRATLDYSSQAKITLEQELNYIKRYVLVENMRFGNKVSFVIIIQKSIDPDEVYILPMLLQPFVENCFEHAFTPQTTAPQINLNIRETSTEIVLTITDNGKGLSNSKTVSLHKAKGIALITERLNLIQDITNPVVMKSLDNGTIVTVTLKKATVTNST